MNHRILVLSCVLLLVTLSGCHQTRVAELELELSSLQEQLEESQQRVSDLESSIQDSSSSLLDSVADLQGVAADIALAQAMFYSDHSSGSFQAQMAADNLDSAISDLESSISGLSDAL